MDGGFRVSNKLAYRIRIARIAVIAKDSKLKAPAFQNVASISAIFGSFGTSTQLSR